tara:strand:+ start:103 stop:552 length:450 start_codon:yes stop_codon:yes gene_type:complete
MIITCTCGKKFNVDASLIPREGRLLKCAPCGRKWHYKLENFNKDKKDKKKEVKIKKINPLENMPIEVDKIITDAENIKSEDTVTIYKNTSNYNFLNLFFLLIISLIAFIIVLDTFSFQINNIIPGFDFLMLNFYESLRDIYLFFKDLIR